MSQSCASKNGTPPEPLMRQCQLLWQISQRRLKSPANGPVMEGPERCIWHHMQLMSCVICYNLQAAMWRSSAHPDSHPQRRRRPPRWESTRKSDKSDLKVSDWPGAAFHPLCYCTGIYIQMIHSVWRAVLARRTKSELQMNHQVTKHWSKNGSFHCTNGLCKKKKKKHLVEQCG